MVALVIRIIVSLLFTIVGVVKTTQPISKLAENLKWVNDYPVILVRGVGVSEIILGIMLILPKFVKSLPNVVSIYSGYILSIIMIGAMVVHFKRNEMPMVIMNLIILGLIVFVTYQIRK